jgi:hypothetical protein
MEGAETGRTADGAVTCFGIYSSRDGAAQALRPGLVIVPAVKDGAEGFAIVDEADKDKIVHFNSAAPRGERLTKEVAVHE